MERLLPKKNSDLPVFVSSPLQGEAISALECLPSYLRSQAPGPARLLLRKARPN